MFCFRVLILCIFLCFILITSAIAATDVVEVVGGLLREGNIEKAEAAVDEYLANNPDDVDVLMMKGNVITYGVMKAFGDVQVSSNPDESIYDSSIGFIGEPVVLFPKEKASEVAGYWLKALSLDNSRGDIHRGLCYVYSMALMKDELIERLKILRETFPDEERLIFSMGDYARMFDERGDFEDAMYIYNEVAKLYPESGNVLSDIAAMYFKNGDIVNAASYIGEAVQKRDVDEMTLNNAVLMNSIIGDYEKALSVLKKLSEVEPGDSEWMLYEGLMGRLAGDAGWRKQVGDYIEAGSGKDLELATALAKPGEETMDRYLEDIEKVKNSYYLFLLHERAVELFPESFEPLFNLAELYTFYNNHDRAIRLYDEIEKKGLYGNSDEKEEFNFYYAWSLYKAGRADASLKRWKALLDSKDFYRKSAAAYFSGKYYEEKGDIEQALHYYGLVSDKASESKYATYSWNRVKVLTQK